MSDRPFLRFINLVAIDKRIYGLVQKKDSLDSSIDKINKKRTEFALFSEEMQTKILQLKKNVDMQELEMKVLDEREKTKRKQFDLLSDYNEYQAVKTEIEAIQRLQVNQEKVILDAWHQVETAQLQLEKRTRELGDELAQLDADLATVVQEKEMISGELSDLQMQRDSKLVDIPQEWLDKYASMGQKVSDPVVPIEHDSCGGCYQHLVAQDLVRARHGALLQCKKCFRLLYLPEAVDK